MASNDGLDVIEKGRVRQGQTGYFRGYRGALHRCRLGAGLDGDRLALTLHHEAMGIPQLDKRLRHVAEFSFQETGTADTEGTEEESRDHRLLHTLAVGRIEMNKVILIASFSINTLFNPAIYPMQHSI